MVGKLASAASAQRFRAHNASFLSYLNADASCGLSVRTASASVHAASAPAFPSAFAQRPQNPPQRPHSVRTKR